jgi:putative transposase
VKAHRAEYPVSVMCRVLGVSTSGYYAWLDPRPSDRAIRDGEIGRLILDIHRKSRGTYGVPRIHKELRDDHNIRVGRKRVARLMRENGIVGVSRRRSVRTTRQAQHTQAAPDLVQRQFSAEARDRLWVADVTYIPTWAGFLYLAVVMDVWSRRIVGWAMAGHMRTALVLEALNMAVQQRRPVGVIFHSDKGSQYTSIEFGKRCAEAGITLSTGSVGDCYDNAMCESFFASLECELIDRTAFPTHASARSAVFEYIEGWYNRHRRHSALDYLSPAQFETERLDPAA